MAASAAESVATAALRSVLQRVQLAAETASRPVSQVNPFPPSASTASLPARLCSLFCWKSSSADRSRGWELWGDIAEVYSPCSSAVNTTNTAKNFFTVVSSPECTKRLSFVEEVFDLLHDRWGGQRCCGVFDADKDGCCQQNEAGLVDQGSLWSRPPPLRRKLCPGSHWEGANGKIFWLALWIMFALPARHNLWGIDS